MFGPGGNPDEKDPKVTEQQVAESETGQEDTNKPTTVTAS